MSEEGVEIQSLSARLPRIGRETAVMSFIAIGSMAAARFV